MSIGCALAAGTAPAGQVATDETEIRNARMAFNRAIHEQDAQAISRVLSPEYHIVTNRNQKSHGRVTEQKTWQELFDQDPSFTCQRDSNQIQVNSGWGQAQELGNWTCSFKVDGEAVKASGIYAAKWQRSEDGRWLVQAEVFTALSCEGGDAGCSAPQPAEPGD
jgi:ketosteroid isomerase-like protein